MDKKTIGIIVAVAVVAGGLGFFGGDKYAASAAASARAARGGQFAAGGFAGRTGGAGGARGGSFTGGKVIAKDDKSMTLQLQDGGSTIVFYSPTTAVMKSASGSVADVAVGAQIIVTGAKNADGSVTAQSIQLRPAMPAAAGAQASQ